jgi:hypothetical protein
MSSIAHISGQTSQQLQAAARLITETAEAAAHQQREALGRIDEAATALSRSLQSLGQQLEEDRGKWTDLDSQVRQTADSARKANQDSQLVLENLVQVTKGLTQVIETKY